MTNAPANPLTSCSSELQAAPHIWIGFSGGMDSVLLLHLVAEISDSSRLTALHINHGIHPDCDQWEEQCRRQAQGLNVAFQSVKLHLGGMTNLEASAREARYQIFENRLAENELLLLAHHANDQAETVIFRMMRGAGLRGLSGMPRRRALGDGFLLRPLLDIPRDQLRELALQRGLSWIEDPSNDDLRISRNFIRHQVLAPLQGHWPSAVERIRHSAETLAQAQALLECYGRELAASCNLRPEAFGRSLDMTRFNQLGEAQRQLVLRQLLAERSEHPDERRLAELLRQLQSVDSESQISDHYKHVEVQVFQQRLYLLETLTPIDPSEVYSWDGRSDLTIPGCGCLRSLKVDGTSHRFQIRFRQGGERCKPLQRTHSQSLKRLLQEYSVPPWLRERIPLIYEGGELVAVAGLFSCSDKFPLPRFVWQGCELPN